MVFCRRRKKCSVRRLVFSVVLLFLVGVVGGLLLWQFLPEEQKQSITAVVDSGIPFTNYKGEAPDPTYQFIKCEGEDCCNGLQSNCDRLVTEVLFAGLHNAQSSIEDGFVLAPNHQYNVVAALEYGYRAVNFDLSICNGELAFAHGFCRFGTLDPTDTFREILEWLDAHPTEVILFPVQIDDDAGGTQKVDIGKFYNLLRRIDGFTDKLFQKSSGETWPTLREMIQNDKRILMFHYNGADNTKCSDANVNCPPGFHDWFAFAAESRFEFGLLEEFDDKATACEITRGRPNAPFFAVNLFLTIPSKTSAIDLLNTETFLEEHVPQCSAVNNGRSVNILFVDYWFEGDVPRFVQNFNGNLAHGNRSFVRKL